MWIFKNFFVASAKKQIDLPERFIMIPEHGISDVVAAEAQALHMRTHFVESQGVVRDFEIISFHYYY